MNNTIQIFASDHRKDAVWNLPFIRITDNDSCISIKQDQFLYDNRNVLSEVARMIYAYKYLQEFGNPEYVGFCHYRRFFANLDVNAYWYETSDERFTSKILTPLQQLQLIKQNNADGIIEYHFPEVAFNVSNINDWFKALNKFLPYLQIPEVLIDYSIQQFYDNIDDSLKPFFKQAYNIMHIYHQNIFTVNREVLDIIFKPLCKSVSAIIRFEDMQQFDKTTYSNRWLAYIIEYLFTNVLFHALELSNKYTFLKCKFLVMNKQKKDNI